MEIDFGMGENALQMVERFKAHVEAHRARHSADRAYVAPAEEKQTRERLMQDMLAALGLSKFEFLSQLGIDRATWDRWRAMTNVPHRAYLDSLEKMARQRKDEPDDGERDPRSKAHDMLNASPNTWGRLRLVYSFGRWDNAVFAFKNAFSDPETVVEIALLALRGCSVVYIMTNADTWAGEFRKSTEKVLGKVYTARAFSKICIINTPVEVMAEHEPFGIFNYKTGDPTWRVGYKWLGTKESRDGARRRRKTPYTVPSPATTTWSILCRITMTTP